ncbi:MAG TPA: hypothetical protein PLQ00_04525 [Thermoguttaceae bacterium]|nr:hypothetical protein [Thermoguttaceae bacterium]
MEQMKGGEQEKEQAKGLECRRCGCRHFYVTHTLQLPDGRIKRRRVCRHCGTPIVTFEVPLGYVSENARK